MPQRITRAIQAWRLAVPKAEHTLVLRALEQPDLLATPHSGRGKFFVEARLEHHVLCIEQLVLPPELLVQPTQR